VCTDSSDSSSDSDSDSDPEKDNKFASALFMTVGVDFVNAVRTCGAEIK